MFPDDPHPLTVFTPQQNEQPAALLSRGQAPITREPDVLARRDVRINSLGWADMQVAQQADAMGINRFEVGVLTSDPARGKTMTLQVLHSNEVIQHSANLRRLNAAGADIHIRPKEEGGYSLSLVDDVSLATIARMKQEGFGPALVVRTSPDNYQAWMRHGDALNGETSYMAGKVLAEKFGADIGAAPAGHMGRLVGTTNRKEQYRTSEGKFPWVVVNEASGAIYEAAPEFLSGVKQKLALEFGQRSEQSQRNRPRAERADGTLKSIEDFRQDARYAGDGNRVDFAYAMYARGKGVDRAEVAAAIATRDLTHKAKNYVEYTISRAEERISPARQIGMGI